MPSGVYPRRKHKANSTDASIREIRSGVDATIKFGDVLLLAGDLVFAVRDAAAKPKRTITPRGDERDRVIEALKARPMDALMVLDHLEIPRASPERARMRGLMKRMLAAGEITQVAAEKGKRRPRYRAAKGQ